MDREIYRPQSDTDRLKKRQRGSEGKRQKENEREIDVLMTKLCKTCLSPLHQIWSSISPLPDRYRPAILPTEGSLFLSFYIIVCFSLSLSVSLSPSLTLSPSVSLSVSPSVSLSFSLSLYLSVVLFMCLSVSLSFPLF